MIKTISQIKADLKYMSKRNLSIETLMSIEKGYMHLYQSALEAGNEKAADDWDNRAKALHLGERAETVKSLEDIYIPAIMKLGDTDRDIALLAFKCGLSNKAIAYKLHYAYRTIKSHLYGRYDKLNKKQYSSIYEKIQYILKKM